MSSQIIRIWVRRVRVRGYEEFDFEKFSFSSNFIYLWYVSSHWSSNYIAAFALKIFALFPEI